MKKRSYNPFKMWGAYLGIIFLILIIVYGLITPKYSTTYSTSCTFSQSLYDLFNPGGPNCRGPLMPLFTIIWLPAMIIVGYTFSLIFKIYTGNVLLILMLFGVFICWTLIGYGIHSLIRKLSIKF